ncbi:protein UsfY [Mycobacterium intracellulare]|uniref:protein UsfY n=1 Tax=Mycobacterium intracellulare TaxID=1767 RepID=UPI000BAB14A4|nr:protein UsfY [Mycobacterium intracellulare]ASW96003.1 UsfY protein [Mycobacterium intracellulare]MCA2231136.1 UsfY protein [Mycobacterium intracellulare]PBA22865.1 UsfY protein [Mycobacterium intracellulare]UGT94700.1 UsfY protein [Mycobacterium intracellulare]UQB95569.1 protein UsfY [Mycobacterium intracellulare]
MGDTFRDPIDHARTTRPHAGESLIDVMSWPGYLFMLVGVIAVFRCLVALGTGHETRSLIGGAIAIAAITVGLVWLKVERGRVRKLENRWYDEHPDAHRQRPAS